MSDKHDFKGNLDAEGNQDDKSESEKSGGLFGALTGLTHGAHQAAEQSKQPHTFAEGLAGLTHAAEEAAKQAESHQTVSGSLFGGVENLAHSAQQAAHEADKNTLGGGAFGGVADAAAAANAAAEQARAAAEAQRAAQQAAEQNQWQSQLDSTQASGEEEFVGSGGVGSGDQLEAIRRGYAERGMADPSALGGADTTIADNNSENKG